MSINNYLRHNVNNHLGDNMVHRSIEIKSMKFKASKDFLTIKSQILKSFGDIYKLRHEGGYVIVSGDLHDYKAREKLYEIITSESIGG